MLLFLTAVMTLLSGCAHTTTGGYEYKLALMHGESEEALIGKWGAPNSVYKVSEEKKVLTYYSDGGTSSTSSYNPLTRQVYTSSSSASCKTDFYLNSGVVKSSRWEGSACVAKEPSEMEARALIEKQKRSRDLKSLTSAESN